MDARHAESEEKVLVWDLRLMVKKRMMMMKKKMAVVLKVADASSELGF
jgi:hypothetical protein